MKKRIALIGNMNNSMFAITRYLRDMGYDAQLFFRPTVDHFSPKTDTFELGFQEFCHEVNWFETNFLKVNSHDVLTQLIDFDFYIGQGDEAAVASKAGIKFDIYYPYGSDFYKYAWLPQTYSLKQKLYLTLFKGLTWKQASKGTMASYIRKAIVEAKYVWLDHTNEEYEGKLLKLSLTGKFDNFPMPFINFDQYANKNKNWDVHWKSEIDLIRSEHEFLVLYHGRQEWKISKSYKNNDFSTKNTHHLIIGYSLFVKANPQIQTKLIMLEYGGDEKNSKALIKELSIVEKVVWLPKMYRKDLMYLIKNVDLCSGEFGRSYLTFGTVIEAMVMGKPVINYRDDSLYKNRYSNLYPCYIAREPNEISQAIEKAYHNQAERKQMGDDAQQWVQHYFIQNSLNKLTEVIESG